MRNIITRINGSNLAMGLAMLVLNVGSKYVEINLSKTQEQALRNALGRELLIFAVVFTATRDIVTSILLTAAFVILSSFLLNENSRFCLAPRAMRRLGALADLNKDGRVSPEEEKKAIETLVRAQSLRRAHEQAAFVGALHASAFSPLS
tara:strand:+ start:770 stop:1216 length:447 start_codon:yes stop_codon:yes gene_type:complete